MESRIDKDVFDKLNAIIPTFNGVRSLRIEHGASTDTLCVYVSSSWMFNKERISKNIALNGVSKFSVKFFEVPDDDDSL